MFLALSLSCTQAMEREQEPEHSKIESTNESSVIQDQKKLLYALEDAGNCHFEFSEGHKYFGDKIIKYLEDNNVDSSELKIIKEQYEKYCQEQTLCSTSINWMAIQAAMALTSKEDRSATAHTHPSIAGAIKALTREKVWLSPFDDPKIMEEYLLMNQLEEAQNYAFLMPVIGQGTFSKEDFLECYANKVYLYSVDAKETRVHGGLFKTPIEVLLHDLAHIFTQVGDLDYSRKNTFFVSGWFGGYRARIKRLRAALADEDANFTGEEKKQVNIILFHAIHEIMMSIGERVFENRKRSGANRQSYYPEEGYSEYAVYINGVFKGIDDLLNDCENYITSGDSEFSEENITNRSTPSGRKYSKQFYRDIAWDLINEGFLKKEDVLAEGAKILGTTYKLKPIHDTLLGMITWMRKELKSNGRLYQAILKGELDKKKRK